MLVKLAASICSNPRASRHSREFAANANMAIAVSRIVFTSADPVPRLGNVFRQGLQAIDYVAQLRALLAQFIQRHAGQFVR